VASLMIQELDWCAWDACQVEEETGIHIKTSELVDLTALLDESTGRRMFPSPVYPILKLCS
jgi:ADP-sugar diphosphatase